MWITQGGKNSRRTQSPCCPDSLCEFHLLDLYSQILTVSEKNPPVEAWRIGGTTLKYARASVLLSKILPQEKLLNQSQQTWNKGNT